MSKIFDYVDVPLLEEEKERIINLDNEIIILDCFVSNICQSKCKHCYFGDTLPKVKQLTTEEWIFVLEEAMKNGIRHFHFSGKECLLDERMFSIFQFLSKQKKEYNLYYGFVNNGLSVDSNIYKEILLSDIDYIEFSIEGTKEINDFLRGKNHFDTLINVLKTLSPHEKISTSTTLSENNRECIFELIDLLTEIGITKIFVGVLEPAGNANINNLNRISPNDFFNIIENLIDKVNCIKNQPPINIRFCVSDFYTDYLMNTESFMREKLKLYLEKGEPIIWNLNGNIIEVSLQLFSIPYVEQMIITTDGYVLPAAIDVSREDYDKYSIANVKNHTFKEILNKRREYISNYLVVK